MFLQGACGLREALARAPVEPEQHAERVVQVRPVLGVRSGQLHEGENSVAIFTKGLAKQLAKKGIRVNAVAPGPVWTPLQVAGGQPEEALGEFGEQTPLGRPAQPAELAPAYVFLASAESGYVSGETLNVNGGMPTP